MGIKDIFENVNNWLKFAEAKNGTLIVFNSVFIFGISKIFFALSINNLFLNLYVSTCILFLTISMIIAMLSFVPKLVIPYGKYGSPSENDNIIYFGDIAKHSEKSYYDKLVQIFDESELKEFDKYCIYQIVINSKIAVNKYKQFNIAIWFALSAILTPLGVGIIYLYRKISNNYYEQSID